MITDIFSYIWSSAVLMTAILTIVILFLILYNSAVKISKDDDSDNTLDKKSKNKKITTRYEHLNLDTRFYFELFGASIIAGLMIKFFWSG
jgi:hypothetical protein